MRKMASETVHPEMGMLNNAMSQISLVQDKYILCENYFEMTRDCEVQFCKWLKLHRIQADDMFIDKVFPFMWVQ
jgi:hypothetical protein